jgi:hypothetical protein
VFQLRPTSISEREVSTKKYKTHSQGSANLQIAAVNVTDYRLDSRLLGTLKRCPCTATQRPERRAITEFAAQSCRTATK